MQSLSKPIEQLTFTEMDSFIGKLTDEEKENIFSNPTTILKLNPSIFLMVFQRQTTKTKQQLLTNEIVAKRILEGSKNARFKSPFDYLTEEEQQIVLSHQNLLIDIDETILIKILPTLSLKTKETLKQELLNTLTNKENTKNKKITIIQKIQQNKITPEELNQLFPTVPQEHLQSFLMYCKQKKRNPVALLELKTDQEFLVYLKTDCIVTEKEIQNLNIPLDIIKNINTKQISELTRLYKKHLLEKEWDLKESELLITALNTYLIFGYDNARKILLDFFTEANENSKITQAELEFAEKRKEYRLTHQDEFYSHKMLKELYYEFVMLTTENTNVKKSPFFQKLLQTNAKEEYKTFYIQLIEKLHTTSENRDEVLKEFLKEVIHRREERMKNHYIITTKDQNLIPQTSKTLYKIFTGLDYTKCQLDSQGYPIINKNISKVFLGNEKRNNNCLLRMMISKNIAELQDHLITMINSFNMIEEEIKRSNGNLSLGSITDIIRVYQITSFSLDYDEQDLSLSTLAKIKKSLDYIENSEIDSVKSTLEYHKKRKWKTTLTIPFVKGKTNHNVQYSILRNDSQEILTAGVDHNCCFKPGAKGEEFYKYCLTNPNGCIIHLYDNEEKKSYIVPIIINGNTLYGNGIEPGITNTKHDKSTSQRLLQAVQECYLKIMQNTAIEPIEVGLLTNLHLENEDIMASYEEVLIESNPSGEEFYCDLTKKDKSTYIIAKQKTTSAIKPYERTHYYEQPRSGTFHYAKGDYFNNSQEVKEIERKLNGIYYTYLKLNGQLTPQIFEPINLQDWDSAIGNNDWFILENQEKELKCILPYYKDIDIEVEVTLQAIKNEKGGKKI